MFINFVITLIVNTSLYESNLNNLLVLIEQCTMINWYTKTKFNLNSQYFSSNLHRNNHFSAFDNNYKLIILTKL